MSDYSEHKRMKPVLDLARQLDIATNPHASAIFEAGSGGFQVWCTPQDHPQGWNGISMIPGAFSKPCEYEGVYIGGGMMTKSSACKSKQLPTPWRNKCRTNTAT